MAKRSPKVSVTNNHTDSVEIPLLSGGDNYILKRGESAELEFDPETPQMRAYRHVGILQVMEGDKVVPPQFEERPLSGGETITDSPADKPASTL